MASHLPLGYRFAPSDVEIVDEYLPAFMSGKPAPAPTINEFDIYTVAPWDLPGKFIHGERGSEEFFLTPRRPQVANPLRAKRTVGQHGTWHPNTESKIVGKHAVAFKISCVFKRNVQGDKPLSTDWLMHEYRFQDPYKFQDRALCRVFNKNKRRVDDEVELAPDSHLQSCEEYTVPPGYKFAPTDPEILYYLKRMVAGMEVPAIIKLDVYTKEPWDLPGGFKQGYRMNEQLFITQRYPKSSGAQRTVAGHRGNWRSSHEYKICSGKRLLGHKTCLTFKRREAGKAISTKWRMYEYRLGSESAEFQDSAICKVYRNRRGGNTGAMESIHREPVREIAPLRELPIENAAASSVLAELPPTKRHRIDDAAPSPQHHHYDFMDPLSVPTEGTQTKTPQVEEASSSSHHQDNVKASSLEVDVPQIASQFERDQVEAPVPKENFMKVTTSIEPAQIKKGQVEEPKSLAHSGLHSAMPHRAYEAMTWLAAKPNWVTDKIIPSWLEGNLFAEESNFAVSLKYLVFTLKGQDEKFKSPTYTDANPKAPCRAFEAITWLAAKPKWVNKNIIGSWLKGNLFAEESNFAGSLEYLLSNVRR